MAEQDIRQAEHAAVWEAANRALDQKNGDTAWLYGHVVVAGEAQIDLGDSWMDGDRDVYHTLTIAPDGPVAYQHVRVGPSGTPLSLEYGADDQETAAYLSRLARSINPGLARAS